MAKYIVEYQKDSAKHTLIFRGIEFDYTLKEIDFIDTCDKKIFSLQISKKFDDMTLEILTENIGVDEIPCYSEEKTEEIFSTLQILEMYE